MNEIKNLSAISLLENLMQEDKTLSEDENLSRKKLRERINKIYPFELRRNLLSRSYSGELHKTLSDSTLEDLLEHTKKNPKDNFIFSLDFNSRKLLEAIGSNKEGFKLDDKFQRSEHYKVLINFFKSFLIEPEKLVETINLAQEVPQIYLYLNKLIKREQRIRKFFEYTSETKKKERNLSLVKIIEREINTSKTQGLEIIKKEEALREFIELEYGGGARETLIESSYNLPLFYETPEKTQELLFQYKEKFDSQKDLINKNIHDEIVDLLNLSEFEEIPELIEFHSLLKYNSSFQKRFYESINKNISQFSDFEKKLLVSTIVSTSKNLSEEFKGQKLESALEKILLSSRKYLESIHTFSEDMKVKKFNEWVCLKSKFENYDDFIHGLERSSFDISDEKAIISLHETSTKTIYSKLASTFGRTNYSINSVTGISRELTLPRISIKSINLPEFVNLFSGYEDNEKVMKGLLFFQAATSRFNHVPFSNDLDFFSQFSDENLAREIFSILTYARNKGKIIDELPKLKENIQLLEDKIKESQTDKSKSYETKKDEILDYLEKKLIFNLDIWTNLKSFIDNHLIPSISDFNLENNTQTIEKLIEIYNLVQNETHEKTVSPKLIFNQMKALENNEYRDIDHKNSILYGEENIFYYDELTSAKRARLIVKKASSLENENIKKIREQYGSKIKALVNTLLNQLPQRVVIERRVYDGEIDENALFEAILEKKRGFLPDENVYTNRKIRERDVNILLTLDQSKFLARRKHSIRLTDYIKIMTTYTCDVFNEIGDSYAIVGHNSKGPNEVFFNVYKDFDEEYSMETEASLGLIAPLKNTRNGIVYKHVSEYFGQREAKKKIHIDIMTELPKDVLYEGEDIINDMVDGIKRERAKGISLFGLYLNKDIDHQILRRIYGSGNFMIVDDLRKLPEVILDVYKTVTF